MPSLVSLSFPLGLGSAFSHYFFAEKCLSWQIIWKKALSWNHLSFSHGGRKYLTVSVSSLISEFVFLTLLYFSSGHPALSCGLYFCKCSQKEKKKIDWHKNFVCRRSSRGGTFLSSGSLTACRTKSICLHMAGLMLAATDALIPKLSVPPVVWLGKWADL